MGYILTSTFEKINRFRKLPSAKSIAPDWGVMEGAWRELYPELCARSDAEILKAHTPSTAEPSQKKRATL